MKTQKQLFILSVISSLLLPAGTALASARAKPPIPFLKPAAQPSSVAEKLGWVKKPGCPNLCGGYYVDPPLPVMSLSSDFIQVTFDSSELRHDGRSLLRGHVTINQSPDRQLISDKAYIYRNPEGEFTKIDMYGNVQLQESGKYIVGKKARVKLDSKEGDYYDALYRITLDPSSYVPVLAAHGDQTGSSLTAHGRAKQIKQLAKGKLALDNATYTTCAPTTESWRLKAKKVDLNHDTGRGIAHHTVITVKDIPVFYIPYFNFPIDKRRQSGFLFPTFGSSNTGGFSFGIPYYWNLAPNYDATITPMYYAKRGLQVGNQVRYLTAASSGSIQYTVLPNDTAFRSFQRTAAGQYQTNPALKDLIAASGTRQYLAWQHMTRFNPYWTGAIDYTRVSDDYYFQDFNNIPSLTTANQLLQQAKVNYFDGRWAFQGMLQQYQTLHPVTLAPVANQYSRLPQLLFSGNIPDEKTGLIYQFNSELVHFWRPMYPGGEPIIPVAGNRVNLQPGISLPIINLSGYFTPTVQVNLTQYGLSHQPNNYPNNIFRAVPIFSIDSGLIFERNLAAFGRSYQQTLEPRLFYLYVPYRQQYELPLFDSGLQVFNYDQLFRTNRFTGLDRIGDANQITLALTTRFIDQDTGLEKLRASIGQIYYLRDRKVMLCGTRGCTDKLSQTGAISATDSSSPIAGQISYNLNPNWNTTANLTWNPHSHQTENGTFNFQYVPKPYHLFNIGYNFIRYGDPLVPAEENSRKNNLNQATVSFAMPVRQNWRTVGGWTYNLSHEHAQSFFYGAEYNTCCWATRLVVAHTFTGLNNTNTPIFNKVIYLQFLLKGMSNIGTNDPSLITNTIPGYQDNFGRS